MTLAANSVAVIDSVSVIDGVPNSQPRRGVIANIWHQLKSLSFLKISLIAKSISAGSSQALLVVEYVLLHSDHFKQARWTHLLHDISRLQSTKDWPKKCLGLEREQIWSLSRERSILLFPTVSSSRLSFPPLLQKQRGSTPGSPQRAAGCVQKPGAGKLSVRLEVVGP